MSPRVVDCDPARRAMLSLLLGRIDNEAESCQADGGLGRRIGTQRLDGPLAAAAQCGSVESISRCSARSLASDTSTLAAVMLHRATRCSAGAWRSMVSTPPFVLAVLAWRVERVSAGCLRAAQKPTVERGEGRALGVARVAREDGGIEGRRRGGVERLLIPSVGDHLLGTPAPHAVQEDGVGMVDEIREGRGLSVLLAHEQERHARRAQDEHRSEAQARGVDQAGQPLAAGPVASVVVVEREDHETPGFDADRRRAVAAPAVRRVLPW